jgi:hypothetical protein
VKRRLAGMERAKNDTSHTAKAQRVHRALTTGRPPVSALRTHSEAVSAARTLDSDLRARMAAEGLDAKCGVAIVFVSPDLSAYNYTHLFSKEPKAQECIIRELQDKLAIGLLFGIADPDDPNGGVRVGTRAFITTRQVEEWLSHLVSQFPLDILDDPGAAWSE